MGLYRQLSEEGYVDLDLSVNLNLGKTLPGAWFGVHPAYRHALVGPLYGTAGLDLFANPKYVDFGVHGGFGLRFEAGQVSFQAAVLCAATVDFGVFELRGNAGIGIAF